MALSELDDPEAVRQAIAEFDRIGRDAFLDRYGFGKSRDYFLMHGGRQYDSKAIVGAAYGIQFPDRGALPHTAFSGGEKRVVPILERLGFELTRADAGRNPDWSRDELILALDLYIQHRPSLPAKNGPEVAELSALLNRLGGAVDFERFRNPNGVYMKLTNFLRLDPDYTASGRVGLQRGGKGDVVVWNAFAGDPERLRATALAIRAAIEHEEPPAPAEEKDDDFVAAEEGRWLSTLHRRRERNRRLVEKRKERALKAHGALKCEACGFDFAIRYGDRGRGYIECHHTRPLRDLRPGDRTKLQDLALVCANCHRMIHARRQWLTIEELRATIRIA